MSFLSKIFTKKQETLPVTTDMEALKAAADYLKDQPKVDYDPYSNYDNCIFDVLHSLPTDYEYPTHHRALEDKAIEDMTLSELATMYTFIERGERFCDGHIASFVQDGTLLKLVTRQIELLEEKK